MKSHGADGGTNSHIYALDASDRTNFGSDPSSTNVTIARPKKSKGTRRPADQPSPNDSLSERGAVAGLYGGARERKLGAFLAVKPPGLPYQVAWLADLSVSRPVSAT